MGYAKQLKYEQAESLFVRALSIYEQQLEPEHLNAGQVLSNLAILYTVQRKYTQAEPLYVRAVAVYEQQLGSQHPATQIIRRNYISLLASMKQDDEAQLELQRSIFNGRYRYSSIRPFRYSLG